MLVHEIEAHESRVARGEEEVPGDKDERNDRRSKERAEVVRKALPAEEQPAGAGGPERQDNAHEALGESGERETTPEQEGAKQAAASSHGEHEAEERNGKPETEQGVREKGPAVKEGAC